MAHARWIRLATLILLAGATEPSFAQHDQARDAVRLIAEGNLPQALQTLEKPDSPNHSPLAANENRFVRVLAECRRGDGAAAWRIAREALHGGMPIARFQAGPREALAPLYAENGYQAYVAERGQRLLHGPHLGSVTDRTARVWVRTAEAAEVDVVLMPISGSGDRDDHQPNAPKQEFGPTVRSNPAFDYTATVPLTGLQPNSEYAYQVLVDGEPQGGQHTLRTFPPEGSGARFRVATGGGAGFTPEYERMWTTIRDHGPIAFLTLGDNVYIDAPRHRLAQRYCYYRRQSQPEFRRFAARTPQAAIYDDHDFGTNDCVPGPAIDSPPWKREVWNVFRQNWANPAYGGGYRQPGCWFDFHIGDVHFLMLDTRYYRDLEGGSMLGDAQKEWLFETLDDSSATFKVIASSVPFSPGVKPGSRDTWDGFPKEREEIFSFIERQGIDGVLLVSADRHRTDLRRIPREAGTPFYELMSSRLTNVHTHPLMQNAEGSEFIFGYNETPSFGLIDFDTTADSPRIQLRCIDIDGNEQAQHALSQEDLERR